MIKVVALATLIFSIFIAIGCYMGAGANVAYSSLIGSGVMLVNLIGIWFFWKLVFLKKSIALAVVVIIFKYLILGLILWKFFETDWLNPVGFVAGLSSLLFGVISSVFFKPNTTKI